MKTRATIADLEVKRFSNFGKYYVKHAYTGSWSIQITKDEYMNMTDRGLVRKYFPNWKDNF